MAELLRASQKCARRVWPPSALGRKVAERETQRQRGPGGRRSRLPPRPAESRLPPRPAEFRDQLESRPPEDQLPRLSEEASRRASPEPPELRPFERLLFGFTSDQSDIYCRLASAYGRVGGRERLDGSWLRRRDRRDWIAFATPRSWPPNPPTELRSSAGARARTLRTLAARSPRGRRCDNRCSRATRAGCPACSTTSRGERRRELLRKGQIIAFVLLALGGLALCLRWSMKYQGWPPPGAIRGHSEAAKAAIRGSARAVLRGIARPGGGGGSARL